MNCIVHRASVPPRCVSERTALTRDVLFEVAVGGAPLSVLGRVGQPFAVCILLAAHALRAAQVGQAPGGRFLLRLHRDAALGLLAAGVMEVVSQVLQVEGPGAELLPVDPLEGHDAVQVATQLRAKGEAGLFFKARDTKMCNVFKSTGMTWTTFLVLRC